MKFGLDVLIEQNFAPLKGKRVGLVTHPAALAEDYRSSIQVFTETKRCTLAALFGPEHGLTGEAQDLIPVAGNERAPIPVYTLYGDTFKSLKPTPKMLKSLDCLVVDLQDVGSRYYTFQATMLYCMEACAKAGLPLFVLDRPNPLHRSVEGPALRPRFQSFVGPHPICTQHGMTMGELARLYRAERVPAVKLTVLKIPDFRPDLMYRWVMPTSPNMPTRATARVYPGMCLFEGTNLSEGRGTTRPFEFIGFPGLNSQAVADRLRHPLNPSVRFLPVTFRPAFHKHAGRSCNGIFVKVLGSSFCAVRAGLALLIAFRDELGNRFRWRTEPYEFVSHIPAIDLLFGSDRERKLIEAGARWQDIAKLWEPEEAEFRQRRKPYLLYA